MRMALLFLTSGVHTAVRSACMSVHLHQVSSVDLPRLYDNADFFCGLPCAKFAFIWIQYIRWSCGQLPIWQLLITSCHTRTHIALMEIAVSDASGTLATYFAYGLDHLCVWLCSRTRRAGGGWWGGWEKTDRATEPRGER